MIDNVNYGIPEAKGNSIDLGETELEHTLENMYRIAYSCAYQTQQLSYYLEAENTLKTCKNIFNFVRENIKYKLEKGELLREPARSWKERKEGVDCDCYSIFISTILINLNIEHSFRIASYNREDIEDFQHVYVVAFDELGEEIPLDTVPQIRQFGEEEPYINKEDFEVLKMNTKQLNGFNQNSSLEERLKALSELLGVEITLEQKVESIGFAQVIAISSLEEVKAKLEQSNYSNFPELKKEYEIVISCLQVSEELEEFTKWLKFGAENSIFSELYTNLLKMLLDSVNQPDYVTVKELLQNNGTLNGLGFLPFLAPIGDAVTGVINAIDNIGGGTRNRAREAAEAAQRQANTALEAEKLKTEQVRLQAEAKKAEAEALARAEASKAEAIMKSPIAAAAPPAEDKSWFEKNWTWVVGGVVGVGLVIVFLVMYFKKPKTRLNGVKRRKAQQKKTTKKRTNKVAGVAGIKRQKITPRKVSNTKKAVAGRKAKPKAKAKAKPATKRKK